MPNDFSPIFAAADIRAVFCNGSTSYALYNRCCRVETGRDAILLPSTSPANARWTREMLRDRWSAEILPRLT